ncbi:unnamed protein product [Brachionus calyciflorus]|uniref:EF-hand domain-containing protein n=1 Tax=Brachionus calyciflorus TaxID=104777 RepID=A0A813M386_9BILA|nr:unnamed protein product [Brachionus calyciflorus]
MGNKKVKFGQTEIGSLSLSEEKISYLLENTEYDRDEIIQWNASFLKDCPNGYLDKKMLIKTFQKLYPNGKPEKMCSKLFNALDIDRDKRVDFVEYLVGISHLSSLDIKKKLQLTFRIYDHDNNGKVNRKKMEKMIVAIFDLNGVKERTGENDPKTKANNIFKRFNKESNGFLNEEEFINGCLTDNYLIDLFAEYRI